MVDRQSTGSNETAASGGGIPGIFKKLTARRGSTYDVSTPRATRHRCAGTTSTPNRPGGPCAATSPRRSGTRWSCRTERRAAAGESGRQREPAVLQCLRRQDRGVDPRWRRGRLYGDAALRQRLGHDFASSITGASVTRAHASHSSRPQTRMPTRKPTCSCTDLGGPDMIGPKAPTDPPGHHY